MRRIFSPDLYMAEFCIGHQRSVHKNGASDSYAQD